MSNSRELSPTSPLGPVLLAGLVPVLCLLPFIGKAFHIDDTLFSNIAMNIQQRPWDYFGFQMNWGRELQWVYDFDENPPGIPYIIAGVTALFGWKEIPLHIVFLVPTFFAGTGMYRLAERMCGSPLVAALAGMLTPVFLVSNSNLMCEPFMLPFYAWGCVWWMRGIERNSRKELILAACLLAVGCFGKYLIVTAVPLLAVWTIMREKRLDRRISWLAIPIAFLLLNDLYAFALYGRSLIFGAFAFSAERTASPTLAAFMNRLGITISFLGGSFLPVLLFPFFHRAAKTCVALGLLFPAVLFLIYAAGGLDNAYHLYDGDSIRWLYLLQLTLFITAGFYFLALPVADLIRERDADSLFLLLLVYGIFVFTGFINWTVNVRTLILIAPAAGILAARQYRSAEDRTGFPWRAAMPLAAGALLSLAVLHADYQYAGASRFAARESANRLQDATGARWFQGHWGFQFYMEREGFVHLDLADADLTPFGEGNALDQIGLKAGDVCVSKRDDRVIDLDHDDCRKLFTLEVPAASWVATMDESARAGFYDMYFGELPYYFGKVGPVYFDAWEVLRAETTEQP